MESERECGLKKRYQQMSLREMSMMELYKTIDNNLKRLPLELAWPAITATHACEF